MFPNLNQQFHSKQSSFINTSINRTGVRTTHDGTYQWIRW